MGAQKELPCPPSRAMLNNTTKKIKPRDLGKTNLDIFVQMIKKKKMCCKANGISSKAYDYIPQIWHPVQYGDIYSYQNDNNIVFVHNSNEILVFI